MTTNTMTPEELQRLEWLEERAEKIDAMLADLADRVAEIQRRTSQDLAEVAR